MFVMSLAVVSLKLVFDSRVYSSISILTMMIAIPSLKPVIAPVCRPLFLLLTPLLRVVTDTRLSSHSSRRLECSEADGRIHESVS